MVTPINKNAPIQDALNTASSSSTGARVDGVNKSPSPVTNIPNAGQNYHWFLPDISGSRTSITATLNGNNRINANTSVNGIVSHILSHVGV